MKIISLGLDNSVLNRDSVLVSRLIEQSVFLDFYTVVVPSVEDKYLKLNNKINIFGIGGANKVFKWFRIYKKMNELMRKENYDIVTTQDIYYLGFLAYLVSRKFNKKLELQVHGFEKEKILRRLIFNFIIKRADGVRVVGKKLKNKILNIKGVDENKIYIIPIYSPHSHTMKPEKDYSAKENFVFLTIGRLVPVKNIELQIRALSSVLKKHSNIVLKIVGDGPEKYKLKKIAKHLKIEDKVKFLGFSNDVDFFYKEADCFLLTSKSEGFGLVVIEAASFGLPVIMTDVGCAGELVFNNDSGLIIELNKQSLSDAMFRVIEDKDLRSRLGQKARENVSNLPKKEDVLNLYNQAWKKLIY